MTISATLREAISFANCGRRPALASIGEPHKAHSHYRSMPVQREWKRKAEKYLRKLTVQFGEAPEGARLMITPANADEPVSDPENEDWEDQRTVRGDNDYRSSITH